MNVLEIRAARQFRHTDDLTGYQVPNNDPRSGDFDWDSVAIDLSGCESICPAATLWCAIYPMLVARLGRECSLTAPANSSVRSYLNRLGLFKTLEIAGVSVDRIGGTPNSQEVDFLLPLTPLTSFTQVEEISDEIDVKLSGSNLSSVNVYDDVNMAFCELANNAVEHPESPIGAYGFVQHSADGFICAVADGGIGIRSSLMKNRNHCENAKTDTQAIQYALQENISVHGHTRGLGLAQIVEFVLPGGRRLTICSGIGCLRYSDNEQPPVAEYATLFPGTLAYMDIPS